MNLQEIIAKNKEIMGSPRVRSTILGTAFVSNGIDYRYGERRYAQQVSVSIGIDSKGLLREEAIDEGNKNKLSANVEQIIELVYGRNFFDKFEPIVAIKNCRLSVKPLTEEVKEILKESMRAYNESQGFFE